MTTTKDALLIGGPRNGTLATGGGAALVELEIDGLIHRYIRTTEERDHDGATMAVYNYDGAVSPEGGQSGAESGPDRVASPAASGKADTSDDPAGS